MLSRPVEEAFLTSTFTNSLLLSFSADKLESFLKNSPSIQNPKFCRKCKVYPTTANAKKNQGMYNCDCGKNLKLEYSTLIKEQSIPEYFIHVDEEKNEKKEVLILCCFDYSGSMGKTYKTPDNEQIKTYAGYSNFLSNSAVEGGEREYSEENITRKSIMLFHVKQQIKALLSQKNANISYKLFVMTFSNVIKLFGDGVASNFPIVLEGTNLKKRQETILKCKKFGESEASKVYSGQVDVDKLFEKLEQETEDGCTSLGPAIAIGLGVVKKLMPKSCQFLIFTDGLASNGLGNIEEGLLSKKVMEKVKEDYQNLGDIGSNLGVVFHMFAFKDETAGFSITSDMIDKTIYGDLMQVKILNSGTYDYEKLSNDLEKAFRVSKSLYCLPPSDNQSLKIFFSKKLKVQFCEQDNFNAEKEDYYIYKKIGPIYKSENQNLRIGIKFDLEGRFKENEKLFLQIQLRFTKIDDHGDNTLVFNLEYDIKRQMTNNVEIDFNVLTPIMFRDDVASDKNHEKRSAYEKFVRDRGSPADQQTLSEFLKPPKIIKKDKKEKKKEEEKKNYYESNDSSDSDEHTILKRCLKKEKENDLEKIALKSQKKK